MMLSHEHDPSSPIYLVAAKQMCGKRVELERRRRGMSQVLLGRKAGLGPAWIRQLEGGYPKVRLEDYLACLESFDVSPLALLVPVLFAKHGRDIPQSLLLGDLERLETSLMEAVVRWHVEELQAMLAAMAGPVPSDIADRQDND